MQLRGGKLERGDVVGGYRIDELISRGGMGAVYRATHLALNRVYALKVLAPELASDEQFRERFRREMRIAASLHHPNVVGIHYAGEHDGLLFLVMDYIAGTDLREVIRKSGALDPTRVAGLMDQLSSALDAAHARGLVHRDVKPANILLTVRDGEEHAYLTDFGLAKKYDTVSGVDGLTAIGTVVGTVDYMAPEQITGAHTDARTDIYALGCVFFQMLTGQVPYERENSVATLYAHVHEPPPPLAGAPPELSPAFGAVIEKAMAKNPEDRYGSAGDFARDVEAAQTGTRYTGPATRVATGEAAPPDTSAAAAESAVLSSEATQLGAEPTRAAAQPEPDPAFGVTELAASMEQGTSAPPPSTSVPEPATSAEPDLPPTVLEPAATASSDPFATAPPESPATAPSDPFATAPPEPPATAPPMAAATTPPMAAATAASQPSAPAPPEPAFAPRQPHGPGPPGGGLRRYRWPALGVVVLAGAAIAAILLTSGSSTTATRFAAQVQPVPTNRVTGNGTATVDLNGNIATVTVETNGLLAAVHLMHIHGGTGTCPSASAAGLFNGHRFISAAQGDNSYGPVLASLTQFGDTSPQSHLASARFLSGASIRYKRAVTLSVEDVRLLHSGLAVIVVHGIDYNGTGAYDNFLGPDAEAAAPALCGALLPTQTASTGHPAIYTASLGLEGGSGDRPALLCHLSSPAVTRQQPTTRSGSGSTA